MDRVAPNPRLRLRPGPIPVDTGDVRSPRTTVQMSWLATALAGLLTVTTPVAAGLVGDSTAGPARGPRTAETAVAAPRGGPYPPAPARATTQVLAATSEEADRARRDTTAPEPYLLVHARPGLGVHRNPWSGSPTVDTVATVSKYYRVPLVLWVEQTSRDGEWGRVELPYVWPRREGWIRLDGLRRETTWVRVEVDLSEHAVRVFKRDDLLFQVPGATGAPASPTPPGDYAVTDRVPFAPGGSLGSFAFGISGIQPRLPAGWSGGDQLAIHGTDSPGSIGQSVSAGCVRVSETSLDRLMPLLRLGTPVVIHR